MNHSEADAVMGEQRAAQEAMQRSCPDIEATQYGLLSAQGIARREAREARAAALEVALRLTLGRNHDVSDLLRDAKLIEKNLQGEK